MPWKFSPPYLISIVIYFLLLGRVFLEESFFNDEYNAQ